MDTWPVSLLNKRRLRRGDEILKIAIGQDITENKGLGAEASSLTIGDSAFVGRSRTDQLDHERDQQMRDRPNQAYP